MTKTEHMLYRVAYQMAMADGDLSANEALMLHLFTQGLGLTVSETKKLREEARNLDISTLPDLFPERADQLKLFETACLMAIVDGRSDPEEWQMVMHLCQTFEIDRPTAQQSLEAARERLNKLAEEHNLLPEILANIDENQG
jgi:tellurite resistance protein